MKSSKDFFNVLFDQGEYTCIAKHAKGTTVHLVESHEDTAKWAQFFTINPLEGSIDNCPTEDYHAADKPRRADHNVTVYRNILIEMDKSELIDQYKLVQSLCMPFTTATYSGGKSIHWIISLETPCKDRNEYTALCERVHKALGGKQVVDTACKNPSRLSRFPNVIREDKQKRQECFQVNRRVTAAELEAWLIANNAPVVPVRTYANISHTEEGWDMEAYCEATGRDLPSIHGIMSGSTLNFIMMGAQEGGRNNALFKAACDFAKCGKSQEEAEHRLLEPSGLDRSEAYACIKSAYTKVRNS